MALDQQDIAKIVSEVLSRLAAPSGAPGAGAPGGPGARAVAGSAAGPVVFGTVDAAVQAAARAQKAFQELGLEKRRQVISAIRQAAIANAEPWAKAAREETGMGRAADKVQKNLICARKTPGVEDLQSRSYTGDTGLTLVEYAPYGVVAAVTPSTNPVATIINNSI